MLRSEFLKNSFAFSNNLRNNMSGNLANMHLNLASTMVSTKAKAKGLPTFTVQTKESSENLTISSIPELQLISRIPGSQPYLIQDLVPDVIFLLQYEGSKAFIESLPKDDVGLIFVDTTGLIPKRPKAVLQILIDQTWDALLMSLKTITGLEPNELLNRIYNLGLQKLAELFAAADPLNPSSLIFGHESQEIHVKTREIEIDIIKNEPEVTESATEKCGSCKSKNVRTVPVQMRGGDEPATILARCGNCKLQWRFSSA